MRHHRELFEHVRKRPDMMLRSPTYDGAANFIEGYDHACEGGVLEGFREWLELRDGRGSGRSWRELVLDIAFPGAASARELLSSSAATPGHAIETLFDLLAEFDRLHDRRDGPSELYLAYDERRRGSK